MPKLGMEPIRRAALIDATIREVGQAGSLDITVAKIAGRAGMSSALAHHYFGGKEQIFLAAMRHILSAFRDDVTAALARARTPRARLEALIHASFSKSHFSRDAIAAWLTFYLLAHSSAEARRLLRVYHQRLHSNLVHDLRPLMGAAADDTAHTIAAMIDGLYLRHALQDAPLDRVGSIVKVMSYLDMLLGEPVT